MSEPDDDPVPVCSCGRLTQVVWSATFDAWLCPDCRYHRTNRLLDSGPVTPLPVTP